MFQALLDELEHRWTPELELAASLLELQHSALLAFARVHAKKGATLGKPLEVPRPKRDGRKPEPDSIRISVGELAQLAQPALIDAGGDDA